jgi:hypothetical protein
VLAVVSACEARTASVGVVALSLASAAAADDLPHIPLRPLAHSTSHFHQCPSALSGRTALFAQSIGKKGANPDTFSHSLYLIRLLACNYTSSSPRLVQ